MAEEKQKSFGIILKNAKTKKQKEEKKLYTIISCCVSAIFLITIFVPFLTDKEEKTSGSAYKNVAFDLADLAVDDEAEKILLEMNKYSDIPKQQIAGGLFSKKQKEERQEADKKQGLPPAADQEYLQARKKKQAKTRGVSRTPAYTQRQRTTTSTGSLTRGGNVSVNGGSSGVSTSIWTSPDKNGQKSSKGNTGSLGTQQLIAATGAKGRASGLIRAIEESQKGAKSDNLDTAGQAAADAFTNNNLEAEDGDLQDGIDELAEKFNAEELKNAVNDKDLADLQDELDDAKDQAEQESDPCKSRKKELRMECMREKLLEKLVDGLIDLAKSVASSAISAAVDGNFKGDGKSAGNNSGDSEGSADAGKGVKETVDKGEVLQGKDGK